jgi:predicted dehydrogenase
LIGERVDALGDELGVSARFGDLDAMIVETKPDIVAIPTGTEFHHELSMRVLEHGVSIEVEKPICVDLEQADDVLVRASEHGVRVAVHHQARTGGLMRAAYAAFADGHIGELRHIQAGGKGYYGGYGLLNIGTHSLNSMLKLTGHCRSVHATAITAGRPITPHDVVPSPSGMGVIAGESITAHLEFDGGVTATLLQHRLPEVDVAGHVLEIVGTEGRLLLNSSRGAWLLPSASFLPDREHDRWQRIDAQVPDGFNPTGSANLDDYWFVEEYVNALDEGREHESSGAEATHVLEIIMGIFESAAYRRPVELPQAERDHPLLRWRRENGLGGPTSMPRPYSEWLEAEDDRLGR